jgi:hypothetical protein
VAPTNTVSAFLAAACACAGILAHEPEPFELRVHLRVDRSVTSRVVTADLKDETETLWRPYGVHIEWTDAGAADAAPHGFSLQAVLARRVEEPDAPNRTTVLGSAFVGPDGPGTRSIRVSVDAIEKVLALRPTARTSMGRIVHDRELARALGRVLAHEIGHVLLAIPLHDKTGLMRAVYRPDELAESNRAPFRLTCNDIGRLRSRIHVLTGIAHEPVDLETCIPSHTVR